jgi:hypothetical protein
MMSTHGSSSGWACHIAPLERHHHRDRSVDLAGGSGFVMTGPQLDPRMDRRGAGVATVKPLPG